MFIYRGRGGRGRGRGMVQKPNETYDNVNKYKTIPDVTCSTNQIPKKRQHSSCNVISIDLNLDHNTETWFAQLKSSWTLRKCYSIIFGYEQKKSI